MDEELDSIIQFLNNDENKHIINTNIADDKPPVTSNKGIAENTSFVNNRNDGNAIGGNYE